MSARIGKAATTKSGKTIIPTKDRKAVAFAKRFHSLASGKPVTDQDAYRSVLSQRRFTAAKAKEAAAELAKQQAADKREKRERAIEALAREIMHLADIRSLLRRMETGEDNYFCAETQATFARAALSDAGTEIEQALLDLDLIDRATSGYFVGDVSEEPEAQVTA